MKQKKIKPVKKLLFSTIIEGFADDSSFATDDAIWEIVDRLNELIEAHNARVEEEGR